MGSVVALRRAAEAVRGKPTDADKREAGFLATSLPEQVRRGADAPIRHCLLQSSLFEGGMGALVLARGRSLGELTMAAFLLDVFCLGIKDVVFETVSADDFEAYVGVAAMAAPLLPVDPSYARRLLRDLAAWSRSIGLPPHPDFTAVEPIFGNVNADTCKAIFQFVSDGKPLYRPGPSESPMQIRRRLELLRKRLGDDGFDFAG